ncbi:hypothetical protein [Hyphomicrobium sp.]|uniref:hypothetical protein n=1 Tax=Hyphomicrobium sp. TaxID=82 RepID=UPI002B6DE4C8|nr:hypothetical protein [Hyphomicrobium sp.]HRN89550.1 hypothetical protein [Hyphomicrobium sp.]HRQ27935.1 hypothetical protein [Hyphomicrobium sp.]
MRICKFFTLLAAAMFSLGASPASAEQTEIVVRVLSKDAKFVGTSMGGMRITLRDAETGEMLATGLTEGTTGDTSLLMHERGGRRAQLSDASSAKYQVTLDLDVPRLIEVEAFGPLAQRQAAQRVVSSQWVVPGRHITGGDGWVLELPGFAVDVLAPPAHVRIGEVSSVDVRANVVTMCGCPVEPKGIWNADGYEVEAIVSLNGKLVTRVPLKFAGETSQFAGSVPVAAPGFYDVLVYAYDPATGNTGVDRTTFIVAGK